MPAETGMATGHYHLTRLCADDTFFQSILKFSPTDHDRCPALVDGWKARNGRWLRYV